MTTPCHSCSAQTFCRAVEQPYGIENTTTDGVFIKQIVIPRAETLVPQHSHTYDHTTLLAAGSMRVWRDGKFMGQFKAPQALMIPAHTKHAFLSLEDNTVAYCIHNVARSEGVVSIAEEHDLLGELTRCQSEQPSAQSAQ